MKTRIYIHWENIPGTECKKHFMISIPRDADEVIAMKISLMKIKVVSDEDHFEAGQFRMTRDGIVLYESQVRTEAYDAEFTQSIISPSEVESGLVRLAGGKDNFQNVRFSARPRSLFCKYDGRRAPSSLAYVLAFYFIYTKKK